MIERFELERLRATLGDLDWLGKTVADLPDEQGLRRLSVVLRGLLVSGELSFAWKASGLLPKQPRIVAPRIDNPTESLLEGQLVLVGGSSPVHGGIHSFASARGDIPVPTLNVIEDYEFPLSEFIVSASLVDGRVRVSRHDFVQYIANKRGGAHFDRSRKKEQRAYLVLDKLMDETPHRLWDLPLSHYMILAICIQIAGSPDVQRLIEWLKINTGDQAPR